VPFERLQSSSLLVELARVLLQRGIAMRAAARWKTLFQIADCLRDIRGVRCHPWRLKAVALSMCLVIAAPFESHGDVILPVMREKSATYLITAESSAQMLELFTALEAAEHELPRDTFDPQAVITKVGQDPASLFKWVRDETHLVPYRGALRGPIGVLMDRSGNSLDRALLLCTLLRLAGYQSRLAHGILSKEQAEQILTRRQPLAANGVAASPRTPVSEIDTLMKKYSEKYRLDDVALHKEFEERSLEAARLNEEAGKRVVHQASAIRKLMGDTKSSDVSAERTKALDALEDHWWVQREAGTAWVDMDPTLSDTEQGRSLVSPIETKQPDKLDSETWHNVRIRLLVEQWIGGHLKETPVLTHLLRPSELIGSTIVLSQGPTNLPKDLSAGDSIERLRQVVLGQHEWLPVLKIDDNVVAQSSFTDLGDVNEKPSLGRGPAAGAFGSAAGSLSNILGGESKEAEKATRYLTAEWIDYEIHIPGQSNRTVRREIFDLLGSQRGRSAVKEPELTEAQRIERELAIVGQETQILPMASQLSPEFVAHIVATNLLAGREVLTIVGDGQLTQRNRFLDQLDKLKTVPSQLYNLALARRAWSRSGAATYLGSPNILSYHRFLRKDAKGGLKLCEGFDIVVNDMGVQPWPEADAFRIRLEQGVLDTNAEALLMAGCGRVESTGEIFYASESKGTPWVRIQSPHDPVWSKVQVPAYTRFLMERDLAAGYVVLVPQEAILIEGRLITGWWKIDPRSGQILGIGERGWGQASTEPVSLQADMVTLARMVVKFSQGLICVIGASRAPASIAGPYLYPACFFYTYFSLNALYLGGPSASSGAICSLIGDLASLIGGTIKLAAK
jgi:hypothetical protein